MEVLAKMKVNDENTGELLTVVSAIFECEKCKDLDEFDEAHGEAIDEFLESRIHPDILTEKVIMRVDLIELADEPEEVA